MSGTRRTPGPKTGALPRQVRNGQVVSDEALAAFYRQRSEVLRAPPNTTTKPPVGNPVKRAGGIFNYLLRGLEGKVSQ